MVPGYNLEVKREQPGVSSEPFQIELGVEDQMKKEEAWDSEHSCVPKFTTFQKIKTLYFFIGNLKKCLQ